MTRALAIALLALLPALSAGAHASAGAAEGLRIIALAPHAAELVFAAGAGDRLVGTVAHSDHPPRVLELPRIGDATHLDRERIVSLQPDLAVAWSPGNREADLEWLSSLGVEVYRTHARRITEIAEDLQAIGERAGTAGSARKAAAEFRRRLESLRRRFADLPPLPAFYLLWETPLMTLGGPALITRAMELCGLHNVFSDVQAPNLTLTPESLLVRRPRVVVVPESIATKAESFLWSSEIWPGEPPEEIRIDADLLQRPGPRILDGVEALCAERVGLEGRPASAAARSGQR